MPIKYKVIKQKTPPTTGVVKDIYYARACERKMMDLDTLVDRLEKATTLTGADIYAVLVALTSEIPNLLLDNYSVNLQSLGIFSLHFSSDSKDSPNEVNGNCINNLKVQFRPCIKLKKKLRSPKFEKSKQVSNF
nr:hypothetical protein [uncultured Carboxylicivirga sp.]